MTAISEKKLNLTSLGLCASSTAALTTTAHGKWHYTKIKEGKLARPERKKPSALSTKVLALLDVDAATGTRGWDKGTGQG